MAGIFGGAVGLVVWLLALMTVLVGGVFEQLEGGELLLISGVFLAGLWFPILGIRGGAMSRSRPKRAAAYLAIASAGSWIVFSSFWLFFGPLFAAGAVLAWLGRPIEPARSDR